MRIKQFEELRSRIGAPGYEAYKAEVLSGEGLVLALFFDEGRGDRVIDASGKGNHGTIYGARWTKRDGIWALSFDGVDDYVNCGNDSSLDITDAITMEAWVYPKSFSAPNDNAVVISKAYNYGGYRMIVRDDTVYFSYGNGIDYYHVHLSPGLNVGSWWHVAETWDRQTLNIYVNGVRYSTPLADNWVSSSIMGLWIARDNLGGGQYFLGLISEVRIYNRALSNDEIARHWQLGLPFHPA